MPETRIERRSVESLAPADYNPRTISSRAMGGLTESVKRFGLVQPIIVNDRTGSIVGGHQRRAALQASGVTETDVIVVDLSLEDERALNVALNNQHISGEFTDDLDAMLEQIAADTPELFEALRLDDLLADLAGSSSGADGEGVSLIDAFGAPPFSVFDARQGYWQERKRAWTGKGIRSEGGRDAGLIGGFGAASQTEGQRKVAAGKDGTSIFDPVLTELMVSWFSEPGDLVVDPFGGGSVRGVVAASLGREYVGVELRQEQVDDSRRQAEEMDVDPVWLVGDSTNPATWADISGARLVLTCPPYGDLEVYSDDPSDLSTMGADAFIAAISEAFRLSAEALDDDSFAVWVVGDYRDKTGSLAAFPADLVTSAARASGLHLYNEAVLLTANGSASIRANRQFTASRKLVKVHQNVLIFYKGDPRQAGRRLSPPIVRAIDETEQANG
jgi:hypothetical protein